MGFVETLEKLVKSKPSRKLVAWGTEKIATEMVYHYPWILASISFFISYDAGIKMSFYEKPVLNKDTIPLHPDDYVIIVLAHKKHKTIRDFLQSKNFMKNIDYIEYTDYPCSEFFPSNMGSTVAFWDSVNYANHDKFVTRQDFPKNDNTGNCVHFKALRESIFADSVDLFYQDITILESYDTIISPQFICISQNTNLHRYWEIVQAIKIPIVPISIGLVHTEKITNFSLSEEAIAIFRYISDNCNVIGVRGEYTAEILAQYGIKNTQIIGCPSLYYPYLRQGFSPVSKNDTSLKTIVNSALNGTFPNEAEWFQYISSLNLPFVEQYTNADIWLERLGENYKYHEYLTNNSNMFYSIAQLESHVRNFNFSIGMRFHGNIVPLWNNIPALFLTHDTRTTEMVEFFKLPHINIKDFDSSKPLEHYYELADYTEFNKIMPKHLQEYKNFLSINGISLAN